MSRTTEAGIGATHAASTTGGSARTVHARGSITGQMRSAPDRRVALSYQV